MVLAQPGPVHAAPRIGWSGEVDETVRYFTLTGFQMPRSTRSRVRENAPVSLLLIISCVVTLLAFLAQQRTQRERIAIHAKADATESVLALQHGVDAYLHLTRGFGGFIAASGPTNLKDYDTYLATVDALTDHPGLRYIGYIPRVPRAAAQSFEASVQAEAPGFAIKGSGTDPDFAFPNLYAAPRDKRSLGIRGLDFSGIPQRWTAMQQARDSGQTIATEQHHYVTAPGMVPIIMAFTPIYDRALPSSTVEERRVALRGFVFSIYHVPAMIERALGDAFRSEFDLDIVDGASVLYKSGERVPRASGERAFGVAHRASVIFGGRHWQLFFYPRPQYFARYESSMGNVILVGGLGASLTLAWAMAAWLRRNRARLGSYKQTLRFDEVFESHPSAVYLLDRQRRFINANARALIEFKMSREELIGKSIEQLIIPAKQDMSREQFEQALSGNSVTYDSAIIDGKGHEIQLSVIMIPMKTNDRVAHVVGIAENITAQRERAWELKESKQMLQLVIDHIPQRVFWKNTKLDYLGCNKAFCDDAGLEQPEQIIGKSDFDLAWHASADSSRTEDAATLATGKAKVNYEEQQNRADGSVVWLRTSKIPLSNIDGETVALLGLYEDITLRKQMESQLRELAHYDGLTKLANRTFFYDHLEQAIARIKRKGGQFALMYFDIDRFKSVNDTYGHDVGDALLTAFSARIKATVRDMDVVARLGGDEFALLLDDISDRSAAERVAGKLVAAMHPPFQVGRLGLSVSTSIGVAFYRRGMSADEIIRQADGAMYTAKRAGRDRYEIVAEPVIEP
ncbi:diguanylate cyclase [Massilia sp. RP-1-19]|uniref:Diguanylate cyclase n=1 Tax=Massilia polaris TaxID=2728846 RepID=A0A848HJ99_9BURK|nr:diguanylate cyclase [Massilia polaris]NML61936.1 diguanylate cyclase [Massilia polaris]